jgi:hypothetical protein
MEGEPFVVGGFPIPSDAPAFLLTLGIHVLFGVSAVICGAVAMVSDKGPGRHPRFGTYYYWSLAVVFLTMSALSTMRWAEDYHLFVLGFLSFVAATVGRTARRRRWQNWVKLHVVSLGLSYVFLLTAFYVDNGPNLPLWNRLPPIAFWTLPAAVGLPLILWALLRHPLAKGRIPLT